MMAKEKNEAQKEQCLADSVRHQQKQPSLVVEPKHRQFIDDLLYAALDFVDIA